MKAAEITTQERLLNASGLLVMLVVAVLSVYMVRDDPILPYVASLFAADILGFLLFPGVARRGQLAGRALHALQAIVIVLLYFLVVHPFIAILGIIWIVQTAEIYPRKVALPALFAATAIFAISQFYHWGATDILGAVINAITLGLFHVFAYSAIQRAISERQLREQTATLNRELLATRDLLSQGARQSERLRISRNLHDLLGHHMTALILNLEVARHHAQDQALVRVDQSLALAKLLLGDLRTAVSELRDDDSINLHQSIATLVRDIPGMEFELDFTEAPVISDVGTAETLLRCAQEAITNVLRHSQASHCRIRLRSVGQDTELSVSDNGPGADNVLPGNGLNGLGERLRESGGSLDWAHDVGGFTLTARLPGAAAS